MIKYQHATVDGHKIFYREAGPKTAPTILLLHGFPTSSHMFRNLIPALADRYHVVAPDLPGFGFSDAPDRKQFRYTFERLATVIGSFTETIGLERFGQRIVRLCASSSSPRQPNGNIRTECRIRLSWRRKPINSTQRCWPGLATTKFSSASSWITPATSLSIPSSRNISAQSGRHCSQSGERMIRSFCLRGPRHSSATTRAPRCTSSTPAISRWKRMLRRLGVRLTISWVAS